MIEVYEDKALVLHPPTKEAAKLAQQNLTKLKTISTGEIVTPWTYPSACTLASLGYDKTPSPIVRDYEWSGKLTPFEHQRETSSFLSIRDRAFCFNEQGTGKTASVIWAADYLMKMGLVRRVLVLCPLSIMQSAWQQDLFKFAMHRTCDIAHGTKTKRKKVVASNAEFVVVNFDGLATIEDDVKTGGFDLIVVDEANAYKNAQTNRWKVLKRVSDRVQRMWMLTGTPAAQSPVDAFGLAKLINPANTPKYFGQFRDEVMWKATDFRWVPKNDADQRVHKVLQPAIRFEKADCLDLPEVTFTSRDAPLTNMQKKYYEELKKEMVLSAAGEQVTAVNAATNMNKLLQISGGAVYTDTGEVLEFDIKSRLNVVLEAIEENSHKVLVFVPFTHTIELLKRRLEKQGIKVGVINGKVPLAKRTSIVDDFQNKPDPHVLLIQPQAASHGLTLTAANMIIWYAPVTSVETYLQANARIDRPGQKNPMTIVHISGSPIENRLYSMLQGNIKNHKKIIDLYREELTL